LNNAKHHRKREKEDTKMGIIGLEILAKNMVYMNKMNAKITQTITSKVKQIEGTTTILTHNKIIKFRNIKILRNKK